MKKYIKLSEYAKKNNIVYATAYRHYRKGLIENTKVLPTGTILIEDTENNIESDISRAYLYSRVSSNENKDNLNRQQERLESFAIAKGYQIVGSVKEIASGLNDKRPKLTKLLNDNNFDILIVEHKDRLTRFGFNYIETLLNNQGKNILTINTQDNKQNDLMEDLISIIYSFSARMYGLRRSKRKTEKIIEELKKD